MERLNQMLHDGHYWFDVMRMAAKYEQPLYTQLMDRLSEALMEDELIPESIKNDKVMERMWNKILYRMDYRNVRVRDVVAWINEKHRQRIIGVVTHDELIDRLANYLDEVERKSPTWQLDIIKRHC